ncbi:hypothetical protein MMC16_000150 [Acarospora aff. strigata]|nr:hypothetical protein [Acarospora aff. strigata]
MPARPLQSTRSDQQEVTKILTAFRRDPSLLGYISLGEDGVLRSLTADRDVLDAAGLNPRLTKALPNRISPGFRGGFGEADGAKTLREQWFNPDKSMLPPPLTDKQKKTTRKMLKDNKEMLEGRMDNTSKE